MTDKADPPVPTGRGRSRWPDPGPKWEAVEGGPPSLPEIVTRYLAGESIQVLAKECGKTRRTLYNWMLAELGGEQYYKLVTECLVSRVADADTLLEEAKDQFEVTRAREIARFARMDLERRRPALYGPKQEVRHSGVLPSLTIIMPGEEPPAAVIEHEPIERGE